MSSLPTFKIKAESGDPKFLIFFGKPKSGKSSLASLLDNNLILDLEKGYRHLDALKIEINDYEGLVAALDDIEESNKKLGRFTYKYITLDNGTKLEEILKPCMVMLYKNTPAGKNYDGTDVTELPNGAGWKYQRDALTKTITRLKSLCETFILVCHTKDSIINSNGKELMEMSLAITGAAARLISADADAIGYVYRRKNKNFINFNGGNDFLVEARPKHIRGKEFVIGESDEEGNLIAYWNTIFKDDENLRDSKEVA